MDYSLIIISSVGLAVSVACLGFGIKLTRQARHARALGLPAPPPPPPLITDPDPPKSDEKEESTVKDVAMKSSKWFRKDKD